MDEKKSILLDVDEVICFSGFLQAVNDFMGTNYEIDDFKEYYIDEVAIPKERFNEFNQFLKQRNLYEKPVFLPHAIETIKKLNEKYVIYICSSCVNPFDIEESGRIFKDKYDFLIQNLSFIKPEHFIFTSAKHLFKADIQIDDCLSHLDSSIEIKILFPSYHNKTIENDELEKNGILRAGNDWREGWNFIAKLLLEDD